MSQTITAGPDSMATVPAPPAPDGLDVPRVLGRVNGLEEGPTLIIVGGMHGNEPAGVLALQRLLPRLAADPSALARGRVVGLAGNRKALRQKQRFLAHDLNRHWLPDRVARLRAAVEPLTAEDEELRELEREIRGLFAEAEDTAYLLDLHTASGPELPFATLDDSLGNRSFAFDFPVPVVLGLEEELAGTLSIWAESIGMVTAGFESGKHDAPAAVERAEAAIWIALEAAGVLAEGRSEVIAAKRRLEEECSGVPPVVEVRHRHAIRPGAGFRMDPGYENFNPVTAGQNLASDGRGPVLSPFTGLILMPLYQKQGAEGFFVVKPVRQIWLKASAKVRHWHLERYLHLLPGVRRHPDLDEYFVVDTRYARWLARELFHLLGFKRLGKATRYLVMARRLYDRSPREP